MVEHSVNRQIKMIVKINSLCVAEVAGKAGFSKATFYKIMSGKRKVYADEVTRIAAALQVGADELFRYGGMMKGRR